MDDTSVNGLFVLMNSNIKRKCLPLSNRACYSFLISYSSYRCPFYYIINLPFLVARKAVMLEQQLDFVAER